MKKKNYRKFEGLRVALMTTFISGFINAYTYNTQGGLFAGVQTGNVLMMMIRLTEGEFWQSARYLLPIIIFMLGQVVTYYIRNWCHEHGLHWHQFGAGLLLMLMLIIALLSPTLPAYFTIAGLALFASIQLDTFKRVRGVAYANIMMTGNIKNGMQMLVMGIAEKDKALRTQAYYTLLVIVSFMIGVVCSTFITTYLLEYALYIVLFPLSILTHTLMIEKNHS